jgi:hypothetical protein
MKKFTAVLAICGLIFSGPVAADEHLVSRGTLDATLTRSAAERAANLSTLDGALRSPAAAQAAATVGVDLGQVRRALPLLTDAEAKDLAQRAAALRTDPVAGYHDETHFLMTLIIIGVVALVFIAVAERV